MISGVLAFLYIAALYYGTGSFVRDGASIAERLRLAIAAGIALTAVLAVFGILYAPLLWIGTAAFCSYRALRRPNVALGAAAEYGVVCVAAALAWPALCRPVLDGDSLLYHLPNAIAFVQTHSVWQPAAPYWTYPPASELFASGLFAASGRWALPLAGLMPALLLTARLYEIARASGASVFAAAGTPLAFVVTPVAAFQNGTLQNDLWLAAFVLEIASGADSSPISVAVATLLKPLGWIEALVASAISRTPWKTALLGFVPLLLWLVRDAIVMWRFGSFHVMVPPYWPGTIAGNFGTAIPQLAYGIVSVTPAAFAWLAALAIGFAYTSARPYATLGLLLLVIYAFTPLAYKAGDVNYVLNASSFRFALPALACGAACVATLVARAKKVITPIVMALLAWSAVNVLTVYWNDAYTHWMPGIAVLVACTAVAAQRLRANVLATLTVAAGIIVIMGSAFAEARHAGFYADWMRDSNGHSTSAFAWLERNHPARIIAENVRIGALEMNSPGSRVTDAPALGCAEAQAEGAALFVGTNEDARGEFLAQILLDARRCGRVLFQDGSALIVAPHRSALPPL